MPPPQNPFPFASLPSSGDETIDMTHKDSPEREKDSRSKQRPAGEVDHGVKENDNVRPRDEGNVSVDSLTELVVERPGCLDEAVQAFHALL